MVVLQNYLLHEIGRHIRLKMIILLVFMSNYEKNALLGPFWRLSEVPVLEMLLKERTLTATAITPIALSGIGSVTLISATSSLISSGPISPRAATAPWIEIRWWDRELTRIKVIVTAYKDREINSRMNLHLAWVCKIFERVNRGN